MLSPTSPPTSPTSKPRVETHPSYERTLGLAAFRLAEAAGLVLDPWQRDALDTMLAVRPDGKWVCFECAEIVSRQNGKGSILEARVLAGFFVFGEKLIMWSAHEYKTAIELFLRVKTLIRNLIESGEVNEADIKVIHGSGEQGFERLDTGQRIKFIARSKDSGRGFSGDLNIIDEAYAYTRLQQSALMPTMSARPNPQIIYTSSPPLDGVSGEILYALRDRGDPRSAAGTWVQDESLSWRDWGLAGDLEDLDGVNLGDEDLWHQANPAMGYRITREFVAREFRAMSPTDFARERLGIWPRRVAEGSGVIPAELWRELSRGAERPTDVAFAVQVNYRRSHTAIAVVGPRADGALQVSLVAHYPGTHWVVDRLLDLKAKYDPVAIAVQDKGPTGSLLLEMERQGLIPPEDRDNPRRGELAIPWSADIAAAYGMFVDAVHQERLVHLDEGPLNVAVAGAEIRALGCGTAWDYRGPVDVSPLEAATLAHWAYVTRAGVPDDYDLLESVW